MKKLITLVLIGLVLASCQQSLRVVKRHHRSGYHVEWASSKAKKSSLINTRNKTSKNNFENQKKEESSLKSEHAKTTPSQQKNIIKSSSKKNINKKQKKEEIAKPTEPVTNPKPSKVKKDDWDLDGSSGKTNYGKMFAVFGFLCFFIAFTIFIVMVSIFEISLEMFLGVPFAITGVILSLMARAKLGWQVSKGWKFFIIFGLISQLIYLAIGLLIYVANFTD